MGIAVVLNLKNPEAPQSKLLIKEFETLNKSQNKMSV